MAIFAIGDLHLSLGCNKPMDIFKGWQDYVQRLEANWKAVVTPQDTVVLVGDSSWGMTLEEAGRDFEFIDALPGNKLMMKGNHDYWWSTRSKTETFWAQHGCATLGMLHNNAVLCEGMALCGTRGWMFEPEQAHDEKVMKREVGRLKASLEDAQQKAPQAEKVVFLHYPPAYRGGCFEELLELMHSYGVRRCYYGHLHGPSIPHALQGEQDGICYKLVSADAVQFAPWRVEGPA